MQTQPVVPLHTTKKTINGVSDRPMTSCAALCHPLAPMRERIAPGARRPLPVLAPHLRRGKRVELHESPGVYGHRSRVSLS